MIPAAGRQPESRGRPKAFTLVECVVSIVIVAVMLVAALGTVGASRITQCKTADLSRGQFLARSLMAEILQQSYEEPVATPRFGLEGPPEAATSRAYYDDIDDFSNWTACPPQTKEGASMEDFAGWQRSVSVQWVDPLRLEKTSTVETGVKRITVTVTRGAAKAAEIVAVRSAAMEPRTGQSR